MDKTFFSVVMSLYRADDSVQFRAAVRSIIDQTLPPVEILIVVDGPIGLDLEGALRDMEKSAGTIRVIRQPENRGLGHSRNTGIEAATHEIIAVMDADDVSARNRFELQLPVLLAGHAEIVGGFVEEFDVVEGDAKRLRMVPLEHEAIRRFGRWRQPMNHVTVMFRREAYRKAGGYQPIRGVEDWDMFHRMIMTGVRFANVSHPLVYVRCGYGMFRRRSGVTYLKQETSLFIRMLRSGYLNPLQFVGNLAVRLGTRLLPASWLGVVYKRLLRTSR